MRKLFSSMSRLSISMSYPPQSYAELDTWLEKRKENKNERGKEKIDNVASILSRNDVILTQALSKDFNIELYSATKLYNFFVERINCISEEISDIRQVFDLEKSQIGNWSLIIDSIQDLFEFIDKLALVLSLDANCKVIFVKSSDSSQLIFLQILAEFIDLDLQIFDKDVKTCLESFGKDLGCGIVISDDPTAWKEAKGNEDHLIFVYGPKRYVAVVHEESDLDSSVDTLLSSSPFSGVQILVQESIMDVFIAKMRLRIEQSDENLISEIRNGQFCRKVEEIGGDVLIGKTAAMVTGLNVASDLDALLPRHFLNIWPFRTIKESLNIINKKINDADKVSVFTHNVVVANEMATNLEKPKHVWINTAHLYRRRVEIDLQNYLQLATAKRSDALSTNNAPSNNPSTTNLMNQAKSNLNQLRGLTKDQRIKRLTDWLNSTDLQRDSKKSLSLLLKSLSKDGNCYVDNKHYVVYTLSRQMAEPVFVFCQSNVNIDAVVSVVTANLALGQIVFLAVENEDYSKELKDFFEDSPFKINVVDKSDLTGADGQIWLLSDSKDNLLETSNITRREELIVCCHAGDENAVQFCLTNYVRSNEEFVWMPKTTIFAN